VSEERPNFFRRFVQHGWMANIVVGVIFASVTQGSLLGIALALCAMAVLLITTARFQATVESPSRSSTLFRVANRVGVSLALICIVLSLYWAYKPLLIADMPEHALGVVVTKAAASDLPTVTLPPIAEFQDQGRSLPFFAYARSTGYSAISAKGLVTQFLDSWWSTLNYLSSLIAVVLGIWFFAALIVGWIAEEMAKHPRS
jgi:hypothetical protein